MKIKAFLIILLLTFIILLPLKTINLKIENKEKYNENEEQKILDKYNYTNKYSCNKVKVVNQDGKYIGSYDLETYVASVVSGETHILDDYETFKAMSVIIRTYTLYVTNNCKYTIMNSEANQVMDNPNIVSKKIKEAVKSTKGEILTLDGKLVKAEYDSFYKGGNFYCDNKFCYSTYYKPGNNNTKPKTHKIKVPISYYNDLAGGHGYGLSQYGAKYLASIGYNYKEILKYFYADGIKISTTIKPEIQGLKLDSENFLTREERPSRKNKFYYKDDVANSLEGDSAWYATSRANEILKEEKLKYLNSNEYCNITNFKKSYDYTKPKKGAIISYDKHLAIVENIHEDNTIDITEAYIGLGYYGIQISYEYLNPNGKFYNKNTNQNDRKYNCEKNNSGCFKRTNNISLDKIKNRWGYEFKCYIYLID